MSNALLEKKLCLAKESPEPIFDLSDCNLKRIPSIYVTIKVLRKECLYLQNNQISNIKDGGNLNHLSLLTLLDLSSNKITKLPSEIKYLKNLQVLRLDNNSLSSLPAEISFLVNLEQLTVSSNKLKSLPDNICNLNQLNILDLRKNKLRSLPAVICQNRKLQSLLIDDNDELISPPNSVIVQGTAAILSYFARENGLINFENVSVKDMDVSDVSDSMEKLAAYDKMIEDNLRRLEKEKNEKLLQKINSEKNILEQKEKELMLHQRNQVEKQKILTDIVAQQCIIDEEVQTQQKKQEQEQNKFIRELQMVESKADGIIKQLLKANAAQKKHSANLLIENLAQEIPVKQDCIQTQRILELMEQLLVEEYAVLKTTGKNDLVRQNFVNVHTLEESKFQSKIERLLSSRQNQQRSLINDIKQDTDLQHAALLLLIEKSDYRNIELQNQIALIQNQLSNLTTLELQNRRLNMDQFINEICERRTMLSTLLMEIFEQQRAHHEKMIKELHEIEYREANRDMQNYWLLQYQKLLNFQPDSTKCVNPTLLYELGLYGVSHYAPLLSAHWDYFESINDYSQITDSSLKKIGILRTEDRHDILKAISNFLNHHERSGSVPSAPKLTQNTTTLADHLPSAPSAETVHDHISDSMDEKLSNECTICMDEQSNVVFLPCGHLCSCIPCSVSLIHCPLCRCDISQKMQIFTA